MSSRLLLLAFPVLACQPNNNAQIAATVTPAQRDAIADTVRKLTTDFLAAMQSVDADKADTFDSRSPDYAFVGEDGSICRTPKPCQQANKEGWKSLRSMQVRVLESKVAVPSPTVAVETMNIAGSVFPKAGKTVVIDRAALTIVWIREPDGWKILTYHQSYLPPKTQ
jgi:ketosteroid isomerase-like protein